MPAIDAESESSSSTAPHNAGHEDKAAGAVHIHSKAFPMEKAPVSGDPTTFSVAFGRRGIVKLVNELSPAHSVDERQRAVVTLAQLFHQPENIVLGLKDDVIGQVKTMLVESAQSRDLLMLQNAMTVVGEFAAHAMGRSSLVERGIISVLGQLINDEDEYTRRKTFEALHRLATVSTVPVANARQPSRTGIEAILREPGLTSILLHKLLSERFDNQLLLLDIMHSVLLAQVVIRDKQSVLAALPHPMMALQVQVEFHMKALPVLIAFLDPLLPAKLKAAGARCIAVLLENEPVTCKQSSNAPLVLRDPDAAAASDAADDTVDAESSANAKPTAATVRKEAINSGLITKLMALVSGTKPKENAPPTATQRTLVQANAMLALMALAIDVDGKKMIVREGGAQMCMEVLAKCVDLLMPAAEFTTAKSPKPLSADDADRQDTAVLLLNTLQTMANIGEEYRARFAFQPSLPLLGHVEVTSNSASVVKAARQAIKVITWRP